MATLKMGHSTGYQSGNQEEVISRPCEPLLFEFLAAADMAIVLVADNQESTTVQVNRIMHTIIQAWKKKKKKNNKQFSVWFVKIDKGIIIDNELTGLYGSGNLLV